MGHKVLNLSILIFVFLLLLLVRSTRMQDVTPSPSVTSTSEASFPVVVIIRANQGVNLRGGASTADDVVAILSPQTSLLLLEVSADGAWLRVRTLDGIEGWVSASLVDVVGTVTTTPLPTATPLPVVSTDSITLAENGVTTNNQWTPVKQTFNSVDMLLVPAGCFDMGSTDGIDDEQPQNQQCFDQPFWLDRTEVTNAQFAAFHGVTASQSTWTDPNRPRENITWFEARDFCQLRGARLPTEAEWEYAARGSDNLVYPWGSDFVAANVVYAENSHEQTADVGSRPVGASWVGALDMSGNVWEWLSSLYQDYPYSVNDGRESADETTQPRALRGGSWLSDASLVRSAFRYKTFPSIFGDYFGFRCAQSYK